MEHGRAVSPAAAETAREAATAAHPLVLRKGASGRARLTGSSREVDKARLPRTISLSIATAAGKVAKGRSIRRARARRNPLSNRHREDGPGVTGSLAVSRAAGDSSIRLEPAARFQNSHGSLARSRKDVLNRQDKGHLANRVDQLFSGNRADKNNSRIIERKRADCSSAGFRFVCP